MTEEERIIAYIDLDAVKYNISNIRAKTDKNAGIIGVVKADAYGHGAFEAAEILLENGADWLAVAMIDEAVNLREKGIDAPILILGYTPSSRFEDVINYNIIQAVYDYNEALALSKEAERLNKKAVVHIKIDTGMGRIGYRVNEESADEIVKISELPLIEVNGMFTHFSTADETDKTYTLEQKNKFILMDDMLSKRGLDIPVKHAYNSAAIIDFDGPMFDMVRPGIILYGSYPSDEVNKNNLSIKPVMSIKSHISYVKTINAGDSVGYGRTYKAELTRKIATIPVGYADGIIRAYAKGGYVLINGKKAPIVGRICMDQFMVDVTDVGEVNINDEAVLLGKQGEEVITAEEIASVLNSISYEFFCTLSKRIPRVYVKDGKEIKTVKYV